MVRIRSEPPRKALQINGLQGFFFFRKRKNRVKKAKIKKELVVRKVVKTAIIDSGGFAMLFEGVLAQLQARHFRANFV